MTRKFYFIIIILFIGVMIIIKSTETHKNETNPVKTSVSIKHEAQPVAVINGPAKSERKVETSTELKKELENALENLPTLSEARSLNEHEVHHTPEIVKKGGKLVGEMVALAQTDPTRRKETLAFLLDCSEKSELLPALRAVCWNKVLTKIPEWKIFIPVTDSKVSDEVKDLSLRL